MHYRCPFCSHDQTLETPHVMQGSRTFGEVVRGVDGSDHVGVDYEFVVCRNPDCGRYSASVAIRPARMQRGDQGSKVLKTHEPALLRRRLVPESSAAVWPNYVPAHVRDSYEKACLIAELVPEASATMSRRCLQAMIRHRWPDEINALSERNKRPTLKAEIDAIKEAVDPQTWDAIEAVRKVGNIGAHFEADTSQIVDVHPDEAALLTHLLNTLVRDWYVQRFEREQLLADIKSMAERKDHEKQPGASDGLA